MLSTLNAVAVQGSLAGSFGDLLRALYKFRIEVSGLTGFISGGGWALLLGTGFWIGIDHSRVILLGQN